MWWRRRHHHHGQRHGRGSLLRQGLRSLLQPLEEHTHLVQLPCELPPQLAPRPALPSILRSGRPVVPMAVGNSAAVPVQPRREVFGSGSGFPRRR
uniref:Uncharacterized protein n=1 Tax=Arundo donax TaxID=35708 RepID=A0A0A9GI14_ARUDO